MLVKEIQSDAFSACINLKLVDIPDSVTNIGRNAFYQCEKLESIDLPDSIKRIGVYTFANCKNLKSIKLPSSITLIDQFTFKECYSLERVEVPEGVVRVDGNAFEDCKSLREISLPSTLKSIGMYAFQYTNLENVTLPEGFQEFGSGAFLGSKLKKITLPASVRTIGSGAFSSTPLEEVILQEGITNITYWAFSGCTKLKKVSVPKSVHTIGTGAFRSCESLEEIELPGATELYDGVFELCKNLKKVVFLQDKITFRNNIFDDYSGVTIYGYPNSSAEEYATRYRLRFEPLGQGDVTERQTVEINAGDYRKLALSKEPLSPIKEWKSDEEYIAMVLQDGTVVGLSEGTTNVYAIGEDGVTYLSCTVTVKDVPLKEPNEYTDEEKIKSLETLMVILKSKFDKESLKEIIWADYYAHGQESLEMLETWGITMDQIMAMVDKVYDE